MKQFKRILFIKRNNHLIDLYNIVYNTKNKILLLLGILGLPLISIGQSYDVKNYSVKDGLPSSEVYSCMQDSKGYMWFATDKGVSRFDGYSFQNYSTDDGLPDNTIFECTEDYKGRIWFRSFSGKLSYFYNDSIYALTINDSLSKLIKASTIKSISVDSSDNLYLGVYCFPDGIIKISVTKNEMSFIRMPTRKTFISYLPGNRLVLGNTHDNTHPAPKDSSRDNYSHLSLFDFSNNIKIKHLKDFYSKSDRPYTIHDEALAINRSKIALSFRNQFIIIDTITNTINIEKSFTDEQILCISKDKKNGIYISTDKQLYYYLQGNFTKQNIPHNIVSQKITSIIQDKEGGLWISTLLSGVYYINSLLLKNFSTQNGLTSKKINAIDISKNGDIWLAPQSNAIIDIIHNDSVLHKRLKFDNNFSTSPVFSIYIDSLDNKWISHSKGVDIYTPTRLFRLLIFNQSTIYNIYKKNNDTYWTFEYSRLSIIHKEKDTYTEKAIANCQTKIFNICKDEDGSIWIGSLKGLLHYTHDSLINCGTIYPILKKRINDLKFDSHNNLWLATRDTGVIIKQNNSLFNITIKNGLISNFCQCLCLDYKGNIWVGTNKGISHIILNNRKEQHFIDTIINITAPELLEVNIIKSRGDTVYAITNNGLVVFNMNEVYSNKIAPPVYITGIKINNQNRYISSAYNLKYDENYLIINFVGLTYKDAGNTQYRYKMEGIDTGWVYTKNRDVQYPKLTPGNYTFLVSAMNNDGVWNQHPASVTFFIAPPFWATWWARSIFILAIASFIFWRFRIVTNRAKKEAEINKHLISMELKELKAQMDPHFLFNNLNTLTQLVEIKSDDAPEFVEELSRYYRYSLQFRNTEFTTLDNELKQAERYLHILKIRFGDNIHVTWNISDELKNYYVATYSMQLLLENITKHNIVSASKPIWVNINTNTDGYLEVKNQYQPKNSSALSNKHGLKSIEQRYQLLIAKNINITQNSEFFSVQLPLISPSQYESIYS